MVKKDRSQWLPKSRRYSEEEASACELGRDQCGRLMKIAGIAGATRTKRVRTTKPDPAADRYPDLVNRQFSADAPNQLWVTDLTYVPTWAGTAYVCFIIDAFSRMIVGWTVAGHMRTTMVLDAIEMARWNRGVNLPGLRCHSDAGSQFTSIRYGELAEYDAVSHGKRGEILRREGCSVKLRAVRPGDTPVTVNPRFLRLHCVPRRMTERGADGFYR
jgi:hypothetical protein